MLSACRCVVSWTGFSCDLFRLTLLSRGKHYVPLKVLLKEMSHHLDGSFTNISICLSTHSNWTYLRNVQCQLIFGSPTTLFLSLAVVGSFSTGHQMVVEKKPPLFLFSRLFQDVVSELKARSGGLWLVKGIFRWKFNPWSNTPWNCVRL